MNKPIDHSTHTNHADRQHENRFVITSKATLHCLIGCSIGEVLGLMIGVSLGIGLWLTISLAVALAIIFGLGLAALSLIQNTGMGLGDALRTIWLGELISIMVMEVAMNVVDYGLGGMQVMSVSNPVFWYALLAAIPVGYIAAWPINWWLIGKNLKHCH